MTYDTKLCVVADAEDRNTCIAINSTFIKLTEKFMERMIYEISTGIDAN